MMNKIKKFFKLPVIKVCLYIVLPISLILNYTGLDQINAIWVSWLVICGILGAMSDQIFEKD